MATEESDPTPSITPGTMWALALAFTSFLIWIVPALIALVVAAITRARLDRTTEAGRMNARLCTLAQIVSVFTIALFGGFIWWFELR